MRRQSRLAGAIAKALVAVEGVAAAYVFGSAARGEAGALSDVDVALVLAPRGGPLERGLLLRDVTVRLAREEPGTSFDVHDLEELPVAIAGRALEDGELVFERDPAARVRAEVAVRMAFHDFSWLEQTTTREGLEGLRRRLDRG